MARGAQIVVVALASSLGIYLSKTQVHDDHPP
jgi:hypothetical protein